MKGDSFREHVRVRYGGTTPPPGAPPSFTVAYNDGNRSIELKFKEPLAAFQVVVIELTNGIMAVKMQTVDREFWERIQALDEEKLTAALSKWVDKPNIRAMIARRERMKVEIDKLVAANGEASVFVR